MGEYAEYELLRSWGQLDPRPTRRLPKSPVTAKCEICGKKTRSVAGDPMAGLRSHMKDRHGTTI